MKFFPKLAFFAAFLLLASSASFAQEGGKEYPVKPQDSYINNPEVPAECSPQYNWPPTDGGGCKNVGNTTDNSGEEDWANPEGGSNTTQVNAVSCSDHETCSGNCQESEVCLEYGVKPDTNPPQRVCEKSVKVQNCKCVPKREIPASTKDKYPFCHRVTDKTGYECIKTCEMPNGDKVDIKEEAPRCKKFEHCCYGKKDKQGKNVETWDPVETEIGDPKDQCRMKCQDVCNDKFFVNRTPLPAPFDQCCTPPTPLKIACFCCRTKANYNSGKCDYFRRFFTCKESLPLDCSKDPAFNAPVCNPKGSITPSATGYDPSYDPFVEFDPRFAYCGTPDSNLSCQYICRGAGVTLKSQAPDYGMWKNVPGNLDSEQYESNTIKYMQGNCKKSDIVGEEEDKANPVDWPPTKIITTEKCNGQ
jgi:hypothetical protein